MAKRRTPAIRPGELAIVCDECAALIRGDEGFLTVVPGHDGKRRWRAYHGDCESLANVVAREPKSIVVRTGRVATYTELLATLAELARCPQMDFAGTAWPGLLQRLAFDTDWQLTDGRSQDELGRENARFMAAAGLTARSAIDPETRQQESIARQERRVRQREREQESIA